MQPGAQRQVKGHKPKATPATRLHPGITGQRALCFLEGQNRFPNDPLGLKSPELVHLALKCLSNKINTPATSICRPDFFFPSPLPQRARQSHSEILHICKPKPAVGPAGHNLGATHSKHLPRATAWHCSRPHFHSGMPLVSGDDGYFLLMLPMEKQTNTHTFWQPCNLATTGRWEAAPWE